MANRYSPTARPAYPNKPGLFERLRGIVGLGVDEFEEARERKRAEEREEEARELRDLGLAQRGIFRGTAPPVDIDVVETGTETVDLPGPESEFAGEGSLGRSRRRGGSLYDRLGEGFDLEPGAPGGAGPAPEPEAPRFEPGAYNPARGAFEPISFPTRPQDVTLRDTRMDVTVPNTEQVTENFYIDRDRTPEGREAARMERMLAAARDAGLLEPEDTARAGILGIDKAVTFRDGEEERARKIAEAKTDAEANRANWQVYNERLGEQGASAVPFDDKINWATKVDSLERDLLNESQIRGRPSKAATGTGTGAERPMTNADARRFINNLFGGEDLKAGTPVSAAKNLGAVEYERLAEALESGEMTREDVQANAAKIFAGKLDEVLGGAATSPAPQGDAAGGADPRVLANSLVERFGSADEAIAALEADPDSLTATDHAILEILRPLADR